MLAIKKLLHPYNATKYKDNFVLDLLVMPDLFDLVNLLNLLYILNLLNQLDQLDQLDQQLHLD